MKILLSWLSDYIKVDRSAEQIAEILSDLGLPCEGIERHGDDAVIDVEVTSNRGDCLGYIGMARELSVATGAELRLPTIELTESDRDITKFAGVQIDEPRLCGRYAARVIDGVKVGPSPEWLRNRLEAIGLRSVNNVVDATNYAMMETGQPPHAFDFAKITEGKIIVRKAAAGERIVSIDGTQCDLNPEMLVIADSRRPVAVAGVMGGLETEVSQTTTTILLEEAYFDPVSIRTTSRRLRLPSEASFRFERYVDIERVDWASRRTAQLIVQVAGGKVAKGVLDVYPSRPAKKEIILRLSRMKKLLGIEVPPDRAVQILAALGFQPKMEDGRITCIGPSWRNDVYREVDLIEEIARVHGYHHVPTERKIKIEVIAADRRQKLSQRVRTYLNGCGFFEAVTVSFIETPIAGLFVEGGAQSHLAVKDESRKTANLLRQNLIGSLLSVLKTNMNAKNLPCRVFEIADTFVPNTQQGGKLPIQKTKLSLVCDSEFRDLRGVVEGLIGNIDREAEVVFTPASFLWAQTGATITLNSEIIGSAGVISGPVREGFDLKEIPVCAAEIEFDALLSLAQHSVKVKPIPRFPAIQRDISIIIDESIRWVDIMEAVKARTSPELQRVDFVGIYRGKGIPSGKKSVTFSLCFRDEDGTLTHEMVDRLETDIVQGLSESISAERRTA